MRNVIAITIGDINGIGIEILINAWQKNKIINFILFCDVDKLEKYLKKKKIRLKINLIKKKEKNFNLSFNKINIFSYNTKSNIEIHIFP